MFYDAAKPLLFPSWNFVICIHILYGTLYTLRIHKLEIFHRVVIYRKVRKSIRVSLSNIVNLMWNMIPSQNNTNFDRYLKPLNLVLCERKKDTSFNIEIDLHGLTHLSSCKVKLQFNISFVRSKNAWVLKFFFCNSYGNVRFI